MKNLIIILILLNLSVKSQSIYLYSVSPTPVCKGDSLSVQFTWNRVAGSVVFELTTTPKTYWTLGSIYSLPKYKMGIDTIYTVKLMVPFNTDNGNYILKDAYQDVSTGKDVTVNCNMVGISEYELNSLKPTYYDLQGNIIQVRYNELIIEQLGGVRKKLIISN